MGKRNNNEGGFNKQGGNNRQQGGFNKGRPQQQGNVTIESPTLYIGGLSYNSTNESVGEYFSQAGEIARVRVVTER